jgi:hypothetical protein
MEFKYNDGGRADSGYKPNARDCVTRAISIVSGKSYKEVYDALNLLAKKERPRGNKKRSSSRNGVHKRTYNKYMESIGFKWVSCMKIGQGCKIHLVQDELPKGRIVVRLSKHLTSVIDGVIHDTYDPSRDGTRCVYGYWIYEGKYGKEKK